MREDNENAVTQCQPSFDTSETTSFAGEDGVHTLYKFMSYPNKERDGTRDADRRKWVEALLTDGELYFPTPPQLNDPFEASPNFILPSKSPEIMYELFSRHLRETHAKNANLSEEEVGELDRALAERIRERVFSTQIEGKADDWRRDIQTTPMCCLSATRESTLMWSYYSEGHGGVCVHIDSYNYRNNPFTTAMRVIYSEEYPTVQLPASALPYRQFLTRMLLTKSHVWNHEREYRLVNVRGMYHDLLKWKTSQVVALNPRQIRGVTVGVGMKDDDVENILRACHKHKYKVDRAKRQKGRFDLQFERIDGS